MNKRHSVVKTGRAVRWFVNRYFLLLFAALGSGCIFVPHTDLQQPYAENCQMSTRYLSLRAVQVNGSLDCQRSEHEAAGCLALIAVVPAGSFLVSGSVVVVGNTLHWLEYQGSCSEGFVHRQLLFFKQQLYSDDRAITEDSE